MRRLILFSIVTGILFIATLQAFSDDKSNSRSVTVRTFGIPKQYEKGKVPVSKWEQQAYDEYIQKVKERLKPDMTTDKKNEVKNAIGYEIAEKYKMPPISAAYLVLKIGYREAPPSEYVRPSKPDAK